MNEMVRNVEVSSHRSISTEVLNSGEAAKFNLNALTKKDRCAVVLVEYHDELMRYIIVAKEGKFILVNGSQDRVCVAEKANGHAGFMSLNPGDNLQIGTGTINDSNNTRAIRFLDDKRKLHEAKCGVGFSVDAANRLEVKNGAKLPNMEIMLAFPTRVQAAVFFGITQSYF